MQFSKDDNYAYWWARFINTFFRYNLLDGSSIVIGFHFIKNQIVRYQLCLYHIHIFVQLANSSQNLFLIRYFYYIILRLISLTKVQLAK